MMRARHLQNIPSAIIVAGLMWASSTGVAQAQSGFEPLLKKIPGNANTIIVIDVEAVHKSPLAQKEGWEEKHEAAFAERPIVLPPEADKIVVAAPLDLIHDGQQTFELAVMSMKEPISMRAIARAEGGYVDNINGLEAAWTPSGAYIVAHEDQTMGVMYPDHRQLVSRWADFSRSNDRLAIAPYLSEAASLVSDVTPIVLAMDLTDIVQPHRLKEQMPKIKALHGNERKIEELTPIIAGIRGIRLEIELGVSPKGRLSVDFSEAAGPFVNFAKPLVLETLDRFDAHLPDFHDWDAQLLSNSIVMEGKLSKNALRRIFSLLELPTSKFSTVSESDLTDDSEETIVRESQVYFKSVNTLIDDLRSTLSDKRDNHALWMERYGRKVDRLPILHVDDDLLAWGATIGESFRTMGLAKRGAGVRSGVRKSGVYSSYGNAGNYNSRVGAGYGSGGYYGSTNRSSESARNQITRQEQAKATAVRFETWKEIEDSTAEIRRVMTQKFQVEF